MFFTTTFYYATNVSPYPSFTQAISSPPKKSIGVNEQKFQNLDERSSVLGKIKIMGRGFLNIFLKILKKYWQKALSVWEKIFHWFKNIYNLYLAPWIKKFYTKIDGFWNREIEKKKPKIRKKFQKEKQKMKEDIPRVGNSLWQRFKELIQ